MNDFDLLFDTYQSNAFNTHRNRMNTRFHEKNVIGFDSFG